MNPLTEHLREVGETYPQHFIKAAGFGTTMLAAGLACLVHALFPFVFVATASNRIRRLHGQMEGRLRGRGAREEPAPELLVQQNGERLPS